MSATSLTPIVLPADPTADYEAVTKKYVDALYPGSVSNATLEASWNYNDQAYTGPPATGTVRFNNIVLSSATEMYISETDRNGTNRTVEMDLAALNPGSYLYARDTNGGMAQYTVSSAGTDHGTWRTTPLTWVGGSTSLRSTVWITIVAPDNRYLTQSSGDTRYLNVTGDTATGALVLSGDPTAQLQAATKHYVDLQDSPLVRPTLSVWYDGADPLGTGTAPANGTSISQWNDKSPNARHITQATSGNRPTYSTADGGGVSFDGTDDYLTHAGWTYSAYETWYFLFKNTSASAGTLGLFCHGSSASANNRPMIVTQVSAATTLQFQSFDSVTTRAIITASGMNDGVNRCFAAVRGPDGTSYRLYIDGVLYGTVSVPAGTITPTSLPFYMGRYYNANYSQIVVLETVCYAEAHDATTVDYISDYLMYKHGLSTTYPNYPSSYYVSKAGDTMTGGLTVAPTTGMPVIRAHSLDASSYLVAACPGSQTAGLGLNHHSAGTSTNRWNIVKDATAEAGSDAGSDLAIYRFNDAGTLLGTGLFIKRSNGEVSVYGAALNQSPATGSASTVITSTNGTASVTLKAASGQAAVVQFRNTSAVFRWQIGKDTTAEAGSDAGSNFLIQRYNDAGGGAITALAINRATGEVTIEGNPSSALGVAPKQYVDLRQLSSEKGAANGYASLDSSGKVPSSQLPAGSASGIVRSVLSISGNTTLAAATSTDYVYACTAALTATLPTAVSNTNKYTVNNRSAGTVTVATTSSQTINGASTFSIPTQYMSVDFISDGANWMIV